ncbi:hypothetical protein VTO73DRAFT_8319 [Trametes versicolor]
MSRSYSAFFYGTLMHPAILRRVIGHEGSQLTICPAVLLEHTRHKIQYADYPAVIPYSKSRSLFLDSGRGELSPEERTVRGTFVQGLNDRDVALLDLFEGNEYTRDIVGVHPLGPLTPLSATTGPTPAPADDYIVPRVAPELPPLNALGPSVPAHTYIHAGALSELSPELWSYADFVRESAWKWVGADPVNEEYYAEVDKRKAMEGQTLRTAIVDVPTEGEDAKGDGRTVVAVVGGAV